MPGILKVYFIYLCIMWDIFGIQPRDPVITMHLFLVCLLVQIIYSLHWGLGKGIGNYKGIYMTLNDTKCGYENRIPEKWEKKTINKYLCLTLSLSASSRASSLSEDCL